MSRTTGQLKALRALMLKAKPGNSQLDAYVITNHDPHMSEYLEESDERIKYVSGFSGSSAVVIVTQKEALLWTDGRYYVQASEELDSNWKLMKTGCSSTPSESVWLADNLKEHSCVGVDPKLITYHTWLDWSEAVAKKGLSMIPIIDNLVDAIWKDRPAAIPKPISNHPLEFSGVSSLIKIEETKNKMKSKGADILIINGLDEIAWLLNLRGRDIPFNPVFFSFLIVTQSDIHLFVHKEMLPSSFADLYAKENYSLIVHSYEEIYSFIKQVIVSEGNFNKVWIPTNMNYHIYSMFPASKVHTECSPIQCLKAVKNRVEVTGMIQAHIKDGVALARFYSWLEKAVPKGGVTEISAAEKLESFRKEEDHYIGPSFATISSSGPHNAIIHYHPVEKSNRSLSCDELYLCDSGAQYLDGTTDVTRTIHLGTPTDFEKDCFTRVFKGQTALATTVFPAKLKGNRLDAIPRKALWDVGLDYNHGTSHGVGSYLHVHEGPIGLTFKELPDDPGLEANMMISNEPGYYHEKEMGMRLENIVQIVPALIANKAKGFLTFKTLTLVPIQRKMLKPSLLTADEIKYLNVYHEECRDVIGSLLKRRGYQEAYEWLLKETQVIG